VKHVERGACRSVEFHNEAGVSPAVSMGCKAWRRPRLLTA
jgi:hypothetical protein